MPKSEIIRRRLQKLDEYMLILESLRRYTLEEFLADPERYGSAERFLQLAIEILNDLGNHLVADLRLGAVDTYADIPALLAKHGRISEEQRRTWTRMIGFRNVLVHEYLEVDHRIVHDVLASHLGDLRNLSVIFAQLL